MTGEDKFSHERLAVELPHDRQVDLTGGRERQIRRLAETMVAMSASADMVQLLRCVARNIVSVLGAEAGFVHFSASDAPDHPLTARHSREVGEGAPVVVDEDRLAAVLHSSCLQRLSSDECSRRWGPASVRGGVVSVPVVTGDGRRAGVVAVVGRTSAGDFSETDEHLLLAVAQHLAAVAEAAVGRGPVSPLRVAAPASFHDAWVADADGRLLSTSSAWWAVTGRTPTQASDSGWLEATHPDDRIRVLSTWQRAKVTASTYACEHRIGPTDADPTDPSMWRVVAVRALPVVRDRRVEQWLGTSTDVTDLRRGPADRDMEHLRRLLDRASEVMAGALEQPEVMARVADVLVPGFADWMAVHVREGDRRVRLLTVRHGDPQHGADLRRVLDWFRVDLDQPYGPGAVLRDGTAQVIDHIDDTMLIDLARTPEQLEFLRDAPLTAALVLPLVRGAATVGALTLARQSGRPFSFAEAEFGSDLARRVSTAFDAASRYSDQRAVSVSLQRSLLPPALPDFDELSLAACYLPGAAGMEVGGDWYDALALTEGRVGLVIGDVMGRGVRAAAVMGQMRATLRGFALEGHSPAEVVARMDALVARFDRELDVTTCIFAIWDAAASVLTLSSAGHLAPLVVDARGNASYVSIEAGPPLGVGLGHYSQTAVSLEAGSTVVFYTDGLVESREVAAEDGQRALSHALSGAHMLSPHEVHERALEAMGRADGHDDDVAVLVVRIGAERVHIGRQPRTSHLQLVAQPASVRLARAELRRLLREVGAVDVPSEPDVGAADVALLLVSEVVTNAIMHAGGGIAVTYEVGSTGVRVEVADGSSRLPQRVDATVPDEDAASEGGRGVALLERLATEWGVYAAPYAQSGEFGKIVWFDVRFA